MQEEIINADGSRNWQANILLDNINRLEQENKVNLSRAKDLNTELQRLTDENFNLKQENERMSAILKGCGLGDDDCSYCGVDEAYKKLKQENKELNNTINKFRWDNPYFDLYNNVVFQRDKLEQENEKLRREIAELRKDCNHCNFHTYRSALEEIREMCKRQDFNQGMRTFEILKVINEVLK